MGRTMRTARKGPRLSERDLDQAEVLPTGEVFSLPASIKPLRTQVSAKGKQAVRTPVNPDHTYHIADVALSTILDLTLQTLEVSEDEVEGAMQDVLDERARALLKRDEVRARKAVKVKAEQNEVEVKEMDHPRNQHGNPCLVFHQEQEIRIGVPLELSVKKEAWVLKEYAGWGNRGPAIVDALAALVQRTVGDHEKLFLNQSFCLKRQSDTFGLAVEGKSIVLDDEFQDTALFTYRALPYTNIERRVMSYTSCLSDEDASSGRHWVDSLDLLLSARNQHDQPFSTRIKVYLVNRPETGDGPSLKQVKDFWRHCPSRNNPQAYRDPDRGVWKSLRIGLVFEMYANPAKLYIRPSNWSVSLNRRIIMQAVCPGSTLVRALASEEEPSIIELEAFYRNLLPASVTTSALDEYQPRDMTTTLLPFQLRTVAWLVERERDADSPYQSLGMWERLEVGCGAQKEVVAYNRITGDVLPLSVFDAWNKGENHDVPRALQVGEFGDTVLREERDDFGLREIRGGMLCEEMGLGKTLEAIALIMLSPETNIKGDGGLDHASWDDELQLSVTKIQATLIVTPETLIRQWVSEIAQHAPDLNVMVYTGWRSVHNPFYTASCGKRKRDTDASDEKTVMEKWVERVSKADIVLTTFSVVQSDWDVAPAPVERSRRSTAVYMDNPRPRSALLLCNWRRVIIDEIQELDIGAASKSANMIKSIKRRASLAISGTPARASIEDLASSLLFLGVNIPNAIWKRITTPAFAPTFHAIFKNILVRHTKAGLSPDDMKMVIPCQTRHIIPIKLSRIERAYYNDTYEANIESLQRSHAGFADTVRLRSVLHTLRMICTHMQVGQLGGNGAGGRATRIRLDTQIMTMMEALKRMEEDAETSYLQRLLDLSRPRIRYAMLLVMQLSPNWAKSASVLQDVYRITTRVLKDLEDRVALVEQQEPKSGSSPETFGNDNVVADREEFITNLRTRKTDLSFRQHEAAFRLGDLYSAEFVHVADRAEREEEWYAVASRIRTTLLLSSANAANSYRDKVTSAIVRSNIKDLRHLDIAYAGSLGLRGDRVREPLNVRIDALKDNAELLWELRGSITERMLEAIGDDTADYGKTLEEQYELEAQLWVYQMALADRREFMIEERNALAAFDDRAGLARVAEPAGPDALRAAAGPDPKEALIKQRDTIRLAAQKGMSLRAAQMALNEIADRDDIRHEEQVLCKTEADRLKFLIKQQMDLVKKLTDEFAAFNAGFNRRVNYFRILQEISDTVEPVTLETHSVESDMPIVSERISIAEAALDKVNARKRYLDSIHNEGEGQTEDCPICQDALGERAGQEVVILGCLHRLCADCFKRLRVQYNRPVCPNCRAEIKSTDQVRKIAFGKMEASELRLGKVDATDQSSAWLSVRIDPDVYNIAPEDPEILSIDVLGDWGSKVNRLIRQIRLSLNREPNVKHIIFSSWKDALTIVQAALESNRITYLNRTGKKNDDSAERFNREPEIQVYLLNGQLANAGLTLTAASVCHLLEPVINSGFEMQGGFRHKLNNFPNQGSFIAIGRIDRLGQTKETTVYCYAVEETVEAKIINRAEKNKTSLYVKNTGQRVVRQEAVVTSVARKGTDDLSGNRDDVLDLLLH